MFKKSFNYIDEYAIKTLYCAFVRPLIEFAVPVWCPILNQDIKLLEQVQHRATKLVPGLSNLKYEDRLQILGLTTLSDRRKRGDLIQMFKIVHGYETVTWEKPLELRAKNSLNYNREITKTEARHNFFTNRIANEWNKLPEDVILAKSVNSFKAKLDKWTYKKQRKEELSIKLNRIGYK
jgi:ribonuclease P/MRP protein subunit RPP40